MSAEDLSCVLISMPWASTARPSLALGILVGAARREGFACRSLNPSLLLSGLMGAEIYETFAETPGLFGLAEHLFAVDLFGKEALDSDAYLDELSGNLGEVSDASKRGREALAELRDHIIPQFIEATIAEIEAAGPTLVGFSCTFNQVLPSLAIARRLKGRNSELRILLGGACVHGSMGEAYARAFSFVDHVFTGEADAAFPRLLKTLREGGDLRLIAGMTVAGRLHAPPTLTADLDAVPIPDFHDYFKDRSRWIDAGHQLAAVKNLPYESARGCWWGQKHHCTFCGLNNQGMAFRRKSDDRVLDELIALAQEYRHVHFMAADNILDHAAYDGLLVRLAQLGLGLELFYEIKANTRRDQVARLATAGIHWVQPGIESFSDGMLQLMHKGTSALQNIEALKWLQEFGIKPTYNILIGFPGETDADYQELLAFLARLQHLPAPSGDAIVAQVHRFSPFFDRPEQLGIVGLRAAPYYSRLIPPSVLAPSEYAYFFERDLATAAPLHRHLPAVNDAIRSWRNTALRLRAHLGPGFVVIERTAGSEQSKEVLDAVAAAVLIAADRSLSVAALTKQLASVAPQKQVEYAVADLHARGYLAGQAGRIVSTIPLSRGYTERELGEWMHTWFGLDVRETARRPPRTLAVLP